MKYRILLGGFAALTLISIMAVQVALAHSRPVRFDPAPGAVLSTGPERITGWFTSPLRRDPNWTFIRVTDTQGNRVETGEAILSADRKQMTVALRPNLPPGRYVVNHRGWDDADNEIVGDCFTFYIGQAAADAAVSENFRLDGGPSCDRFEGSAKEGTPVPGATAVAAQPEDEVAHEEGEGGTAGDGGVALWLLFVAGGFGLVIGAAGMRLIPGKGGS